MTMPAGWTGGCPVMQWTMGTAAPTVAANTWTTTTKFVDTWGVTGKAYHVWYNRMTKTVSNIGETVGISANWYGAECVNPTTNHADPTEQYALVGKRFTGCCGFGANPSSIKADTQLSWAYLTDN